MSAYENVVNLCKSHGIAQTALEKELGFARGSIGKMKTSNMTHARLQKIADYFNVSIDFILTGEAPEQESITEKKWYFSDETAAVAQEIFDNPDLHALFDAAKDSRPEDLRLTADMLKRLKSTNIDG